jgi:hypothetical protein
MDPKILNDDDINHILEKFDVTDPVIQRRTIVTLIVLRINILDAVSELMDNPNPNECKFVDNVRKALALTKGL